MSHDYEDSREFKDNCKYAQGYWAPYHQDAQVYTLAASGYTWTREEREQLARDHREPIEFNIMRRPLEFFSGYLRDNINQIIYSPVEGSDQKTADQFTKLSYHVWDKGKGFPVFLGACDEGFKSGMSLVGIQMDYSKDFLNGDISFFSRTYNSFYLDPTFEKIDLSDCAFAITRDLVDKEYAKQLLPFVEGVEIDDLTSGFQDDKFMDFHPQFSTFKRNKKLVTYDQYYKRITKKRKFLVDLDSSFFRDITDMPKEEMDRLKTGMSRLQRLRNDPDFQENLKDIPNVEIMDVNRPFVELNIYLNGQKAYQGDDKTGVVNTYPFAPIICYLEPSIFLPSQRIQGIASTNWSLQRQFNKRHMKIFDMMDSTIATGYKYLLGSVPNPEELKQSGQNKVIGVDPDNAPEGLNSVQELRGGDTSPALIEYQKILNELSLTLANVTESVLGVDEGGNTQVSGRLAQVRIAQGLRGNRKIFDNVETTQQVLGEIILQAIQSNYPAGKVERIIAEEPTEQFYEKEFEQYDAVVKQGVRSQSQKDAYYYELVQLKKDEVVNVPESAIVKALSLAGLSDLEEDIERQEQEKQEQQAKINSQEEMAMELANSQKIANLALSKEREARVLADIGLAQERSSEATSNLADAALARAKTMVEIDSMNEERLMKVYGLMEQLHAEEKANELEEEKRNDIRASNIVLTNDLKGSSPSQTQQNAAPQGQGVTPQQ